MPIQPLNLDDRTFADLVDAARKRIRGTSPEWTDFSPANPGMALVDVFAYLTEQLQFRVNLVPDKLRVELFRMLDVFLQPASPAVVTLRLTLDPKQHSASIPRFSSFQSSSGQVFMTLEDVSVEPNATAVDVPAYQVERVTKDVGITSGIPGQVLRLNGPPPAHEVTRLLSVVVGVEYQAQDINVSRDVLFRDADSDWVRWQEVESFADASCPQHCVVVARSFGEIRFPPSLRTATLLPALATPAAGRRVRVLYFRTDGAAGNVAAGATWKATQPIAGVIQVAATGAAMGGANAESMEHAVKRAPLEVSQLRRAVTARDYAAFARQVPGVRRAVALAAVQYRASAVPGTVDLILVPEPTRSSSRVTLEELQTPSDEVLRQVQERLEQRRVLGSALRVRWAKYQVINVSARVVVDTTTPVSEMKRRLTKRLHDLVQPLGDWPFGLAVRVSNIYEALLAEPGVRYAEQVKLSVPVSPNQSSRSVQALQWSKPGNPTRQVLWFAGSGSRLFQSQNDGQSWEAAHDFGEGEVAAIAISSDDRQPSVVAVAVVREGQAADSTVWLSDDAGETWRARAELQGRGINALAWTRRSDRRYLLVGSNSGLFELEAASDAGPSLLRFDPSEPERGVVGLASQAMQEESLVAIAPFGAGEFFLSRRGGADSSYERFDSSKRNVRCVAFQRVGARYYLWAGLAADGDQGYGCLRIDLLEANPQTLALATGWRGGSCLGLAFSGLQVLASSYNQGLLRADSTNIARLEWRSSEVDGGLPLENRQEGRFEPVTAIACAAQTVVVGTRVGVFSSLARPAGTLSDLGAKFQAPDHAADSDCVSLPPQWLPCSGEHVVEVIPISRN